MKIKGLEMTVLTLITEPILKNMALVSTIVLTVTHLENRDTC